MYIIDGIAYAGEQAPELKVTGVRPLDNLMLWVRFNNGEARLFDCASVVSSPVFEPLRDPAVFKNVYIDYGVPVWNDGDIDLAPDYIYENSIAAQMRA